jgi:propionyl-CoA synthetase
MQFMFNVKPNETIFCASDIGWVVGHTYIIYAPLLNGSTSVLFEGKPVGTPNAGVFWRVVNDYNVKALFTAPTALRAIKRDDDEGKYVATGGLESGNRGLKGLEAIFLAGERSESTIVTFYQGNPISYGVKDRTTRETWGFWGNCY